MSADPRDNISAVRLILASASLRRAELLRAAGFDFEMMASEVDETPRPGEAGETYTLRVARDKTRHVAGRQPDGTVVLGADTEVLAAGAILGKPADTADAARMLRLLSGRVHLVITAVVIVAGSRTVEAVAATEVRFSPMTEQDIEWYVATGEPMGKAGAYGIQGRGARFVEWIQGSWSNVVGLPIATVHRLLREVE